MRYDLTDGVSYHSIEAATTDAAEAEARRWIEGGDYLHPELPRTTWVDCRITELDADGAAAEGGQSWTITVKIDPLRRPAHRPMGTSGFGLTMCAVMVVGCSTEATVVGAVPTRSSILGHSVPTPASRGRQA